MTVECSACFVDVTENLPVPVVTHQFNDQFETTIASFLEEALKAGVYWKAQAILEAGEGVVKGLPQYYVTSVVRPVTKQVSKSFDGDEEQALAAGWVLNEWGWCCQDCAGTDYTGEDHASASSQDENFQAMLDGVVLGLARSNNSLHGLSLTIKAGAVEPVSGQPLDLEDIQLPSQEKP